MAADHTGLRVSRRQLVQGAGVVGLGLLAGCGATPFGPQAGSNQNQRRHRIGILLDAAASASDDPSRLEATFREGLAELGYIDGNNVTFEVRYTGGDGHRLAAAAIELAQLPADVIVTTPTNATRAARDATSTIPIVHLVGGGDLVALGLVASLARPGGNVTGLTNVTPELFGKLLQLLKEVAPAISRVAVVAPPLYLLLPEGEDIAATRALGIEVEHLHVSGHPDLDPALQAVARGSADALMVPATPFTIPRRQAIAEFASQTRLPAIYDHQGFVRAGGLMAYGPNQSGNARRAASFVDRILKGTRAADLPVERPMRFSFQINLKTAQALGLTIPQHVLLQATEVIQ